MSVTGRENPTPVSPRGRPLLCPAPPSQREGGPEARTCRIPTRRRRAAVSATHLQPLFPGPSPTGRDGETQTPPSTHRANHPTTGLDLASLLPGRGPPRRRPDPPSLTTSHRGVPKRPSPDLSSSGAALSGRSFLPSWLLQRGSSSGDTAPSSTGGPRQRGGAPPSASSSPGLLLVVRVDSSKSVLHR